MRHSVCERSALEDRDLYSKRERAATAVRSFLLPVLDSRECSEPFLVCIAFAIARVKRTTGAGAREGSVLYRRDALVQSAFTLAGSAPLV